MMEFFLSKVWLFVGGIAVTGVLVLAFSGIDRSVSDDESQRRVDQLADALDAVSNTPDLVSFRLSVADYLPDARSSMLISKGYVCIQEGTDRSYASLHCAIVLTHANGSDDLTVSWDDILLVNKGMGVRGIIQVQVAKERTVSLTA